MWRAPSAVSTELGPTIGRSGDSPVSDGACSGLAVKSERTWSGWLVTTVLAAADAPRKRKTSPSSRRARNTNSIWRTLKRSVCTQADSGSERGSSIWAPGPAGPAGEGAASPSSSGRASGTGGATTVWVLMSGPPVCRPSPIEPKFNRGASGGGPRADCRRRSAARSALGDAAEGPLQIGHEVVVGVCGDRVDVRVAVAAFPSVSRSAGMCDEPPAPGRCSISRACCAVRHRAGAK